MIAAALLEVEDLNVWFDLPSGAKLHAVQDVSFSVAAGTRLGMVGESGCGKTTTVLALMGLLPPTASVSGRVLFDCVDVLERAGVHPAERLVAPLLSAALDNALRHGDRALTGPVARGDAGTVRTHLRELDAVLRDPKWETPKPGDPAFALDSVHLIATAATALA